MRWDATTLHFGVRILQRFFKLDKSDMLYSRVTQPGWKVIIWVLRTMASWWIAMAKRRRRTEMKTNQRMQRIERSSTNKIWLFIPFLLVLYACEKVYLFIFVTTINVVSGNRYFSIKNLYIFVIHFCRCACVCRLWKWKKKIK